MSLLFIQTSSNNVSAKIHPHHVCSWLAEDASSPCDVVHGLSEKHHGELPGRRQLEKATLPRRHPYAMMHEMDT